MKRYFLPVLLVVGFVLSHRICAEAPKDEHAESPHTGALALVFATQQKTIAEVDTENWWHDVKERQWVVKRPFSPGWMNSTHVFEVTYRIGGKDVASWLVDTQKKSVDRTAIAGARKAK